MSSRLAAPLLVFFLIALSACSSDSSRPRSRDILLAQDFENLLGWGGIEDKPPQVLTTTTAHSGKFAACVGGPLEYGLGFVRTLGDLTPVRPKKLELSVWCYLTDAGSEQATAIFQIERPSSREVLLWESLNLKKSVPTKRKWTRVSKVLTVPASIDFSDMCRLYFWRNTATGEAYFDDVELKIVE